MEKRKVLEEKSMFGAFELDREKKGVVLLLREGGKGEVTAFGRGGLRGYRPVTTFTARRIALHQPGKGRKGTEERSSMGKKKKSRFSPAALRGMKNGLPNHLLYEGGGGTREASWPDNSNPPRLERERSSSAIMGEEGGWRKLKKEET